MRVCGGEEDDDEEKEDWKGGMRNVRRWLWKFGRDLLFVMLLYVRFELIAAVVERIE